MFHVVCVGFMGGLRWFAVVLGELRGGLGGLR